MEYNITSTNFAGSWTAVGGSAISGLTSGTYFVRTVADQSVKKFRSFAKEVIVPAGSSPSAGPSVGDGGDSTVETAQTGIDLIGLELLLLLLLLLVIPLRYSPSVRKGWQRS
jgi:hypothetical protein